MNPPRKEEKSPPPATTKALRTENSDVKDGKRPWKKGAHHTPMPNPAQKRNAVAAKSYKIDRHFCGKVVVVHVIVYWHSGT